MKLKRVLAGVLAAVVAVGSLSISAFAKPGDTGTFDGFNYEELEDGTLIITEYVGDGGNVVIPAEIEGKEVTQIKEWSFRGSKNLTSVEIPDTITKIGDAAFTYCPILSINVDENNKYYASIDGVLFDKDISVIIFYPQGKQETEYFIPDSVTKIGGYAFFNRDRYGEKSIGEPTFSYPNTYPTEENTTEPHTLVSVKIPNGVTEIGYHAFSYRNSLETINIPDSVTYIGDYAFESCDSLSSFEMPDSVTYLGEGAFEYCQSLSSIKLSNGLIEIQNDTFRGCAFKSFEFPYNIVSIGEGAFTNCRSLESVAISDSVTYIGDFAFYGCGIKTIEIPNSVTYLGIQALSFCHSLTSVELPNSITEINNYTFWNSSSLTSIVIPDSVVSIGDGVFLWCSSLTSATIPANVTAIGNAAFDDCSDDLTIYGYTSTVAEEYAKEHEIPFVALSFALESNEIKIEGALPYDTILTAEKGEETETGIAYNITLEDTNGDPVQPTTEVTVTIHVPEELAGADNYYVYYQADDGTLTDMNATYADGYVTFTTTHFSTYIISTVEMSNTEDDTTTTTTESDATTGSNVGDTENGNEDDDKNMPTGVTILVIPALAAAAGVIISKKRR